MGAVADSLHRDIGKSDGCFLCHNLAHPNGTRRTLSVANERSLVVLNRFPYNNGHLLIAPIRHIAAFEEASNDEMLELVKLIRESQAGPVADGQAEWIQCGHEFQPVRGGRVARPYAHPRRAPLGRRHELHGVCSDTRVISQSLIALLEELKQASAEHGLPAL